MEEESTRDQPEGAPSREPVLDRARRNTLIRGLFMLLFGVVYQVLEFVFLVGVVVQFLFALFARERNPRLTAFSERLVAYMAQVWDFLAFHTERKPFPFSDLPTHRWDQGESDENDAGYGSQQPQQSGT